MLKGPTPKSIKERGHNVPTKRKEGTRANGTMSNLKNAVYLKEFYTVEQLSEELNITEKYLRQQISAGDLIASRTANRYILQREDIKSWLDENKQIG